MLAAVGLCVRRGGRMLLKDLSFAVSGGGALQLAGGNGAGKTSLMRVLAGLLPAARGTLTRPEARHFLPVADGLKPSLTVAETMRFQAAWHDAPGDVLPALDRLGLASLADRPVRFLSTGQRRRLALGPLLLAPRPLWLLDEPTLGLDSGAVDLLCALIEAQRAGGGAVVFASHQPLPLTDAAVLELTA